MRRTTGFLTLLALTIFGAACSTAENSNSNANANSTTTVSASPSPTATPANVNANVHANMNASEHANRNMGNMNMGKRRLMPTRSLSFNFTLSYSLKMPAGLFADSLHLESCAQAIRSAAIPKMRSTGWQR